MGHAAHHGGSWKVAYADFVTAMMAFFMVLWIMGLSDDNKASIQGYFNDPSGFMKNPPHTRNTIPMQADSRNAMHAASTKGSGLGDAKGADMQAEDDAKYVKREIEEKVKEIDAKDHVIVTETSEGILIEFLEDITSVFFESGSATISPLGKKVIRQVVPIVEDTGRFLVLEGHTDKKPYASGEFTNWELSLNRASAFRLELWKCGIPDVRFKEVRGYAATRLKFPKKPFAAGNRRVALLLPWGKKAGSPNSTRIENSKTRESLAPHGSQDVNILVEDPKPPHL